MLPDTWFWRFYASGPRRLEALDKHKVIFRGSFFAPNALQLSVARDPMTDRWHNYFEDGAVCFWTSSIIERIPALRSPTAARCFLSVIDDYRRRYGVRLPAYVVMHDHVHLLLWAERGETVEKFLEQVLRHTSSEIATPNRQTV